MLEVLVEQGPDSCWYLECNGCQLRLKSAVPYSLPDFRRALEEIDRYCF